MLKIYTIAQATIDAANPSSHTVLTRAFFTTSTGAVQLWQQDEEQWTREEALAALANGAVEFVEVPEAKAAQAEEGGSEEGFWGRVARQVMDGKDFPAYLLNFVKRFATGSYESASSPAAPTSAASNSTAAPFSRDLFGFRQLIIAATPYGKIYALDSSTGNIVWSRVVGLGWAREVGAQVVPVKMFVTKSVGDEVEGSAGPQVVLVAQRKAENVSTPICFNLSKGSVLIVSFTELGRHGHIPHRRHDR